MEKSSGARLVQKAPAYYDDSLTGPQPKFKKQTSYPILNTMTTFPPQIPLANVQRGPTSQQEMARGAAALATTVATSKDDLGVFDNFCIALGIQPRNSQKVQKTHEKTEKKTINELGKILNDLAFQKEVQINNMERAQVQIANVEGSLTKFLAEGGSKEHPAFLNFLTRYNQCIQAMKNAKREIAILTERERDAHIYRQNITEEVYTNQINGTILEYHKSAKSLGIESRQLKNMKEISKATEKQAMRRELGGFLAPTSRPDEEVELSDDLQKMVARCESMASNMKGSHFTTYTPGPPSPPPGNNLVDSNLLIDLPQTHQQQQQQEGEGEEEDDDERLL